MAGSAAGRAIGVLGSRHGPAEASGGHREGLGWLRERGLPARVVSDATFVGDFQESFARQRRAFLASPLSTAVITLWRAATGRTPELGPLPNQPGARARLQALLTGQTGSAGGSAPAA